jgi:hypothetical protein
MHLFVFIDNHSTGHMRRTGGLLFRYLEDWEYLDAFYFCFITMATVGKCATRRPTQVTGFGDFVPTRDTFMFITMCYIVFGLALTTMCIDLAGTEYIRKIHYVGTKMETAKSLVGGAVARCESPLIQIHTKLQGRAHGRNILPRNRLRFHSYCRLVKGQ